MSHHPVFGDAKVHPVTGRHIEQGIGALPEKLQVQHHLAEIEAADGKEVADRMRGEIAALEKGKEFPGQQTANHLKAVEKSEGKGAADALRKEGEA